jgi:beta-mannosidase
VTTLQHHVYVVNGVRIYAQGANWVPPDSFESRATKSVLCELLSRARAANMNFLRIWGGGIYPQNDFFECADELGLLLEQDGIFSNGQYPDDPAFLVLVAEEIQYQARRLASHPSLFMWSGSNELSPSSAKSWPTIFLDTVFPNLTSIDSSRPVWPACPAFPWKTGVDVNGLPNGQPFAVSSVHGPGAPNEVHAYWFSLCVTVENCAAGVNGLQPVDDAFYANTSFASEFGWIGMPSLESLVPVLGTPAEDYTMHSKAMVDRQNRITPIATSENQVIYNFGQHVAPYINVSSSGAFRRVIHMSMVVQSDCLSAEATHYRRGRDTIHATAGATFWMLDDNWCAIPPSQTRQLYRWLSRLATCGYSAFSTELHCLTLADHCCSAGLPKAGPPLNGVDAQSCYTTQPCGTPVLLQSARTACRRYKTAAS